MLIIRAMNKLSPYILSLSTNNAQQIEWFKAGGALNIIRRQMVS
jgi:aconitase A